MLASQHGRVRILMVAMFIFMVYIGLILMVARRPHISFVVLWCNVGDARWVSVADIAWELSNEP